MEHIYSLKGSKLMQLDEVRDLGVINDAKLSYEKHVDHIAKKANKAMYPATIMYLKDTKFDWNLTTGFEDSVATCHRNPYFEMTGGKMLGGSSSLNFHIYGRGYPEDYNSWAEITKDDAWKWENVLPYFIKSERLTDPKILNSPAKIYHGVEGNLGVSRDTFDASDFLDAMKTLGHESVVDINDDTPLGYMNALFTIADGVRQSSAHAYLTPAKNRPNLHVLKNTLVHKIIIENKNAVGVEVLTKNGVVTLKADKEVIVSAGTFGSPKLLMLSGIGPKERLLSKGIDVIEDLPVGKNLHDHVVVTMIYKMNKSIDFESFVTDHPVPALVGYVALDKCQKFPDYQTQNYFAHPEVLISYCSFEARYRPEICDNLYYQKNHLVVQVVHLNPKSRGDILLKNSNPIDKPIIKVGYLTNKNDIEDLLTYVEDYNRIVNTSYFNNIGGELVTDHTNCKAEFGSRKFWMCYIHCMMNGVRHFSGTCKMGSVVDSKLRVIGVNRLRVVDASVMPQVVR
ncbi:putative ecdysone oxidase, partial [Operophtera brumata]